MFVDDVAVDAIGYSDDFESGDGGWVSDVQAFGCLAALRDFQLAAGRLTVINNGAAGMANFAGSHCGVITRIATSPSPHQPLYSIARDGVHVDAIAVDYDLGAFLDRFLARWPAGSPAHASYYRRIVDGPDYTIAQAAPR